MNVMLVEYATVSNVLDDTVLSLVDSAIGNAGW